MDCEKQQPSSKKTGERKWWSLSIFAALGLTIIVTLVGLMVVGKLDTVADAMNLADSPITNAANATMWTICYSNTYSAFNLVVIIPIVLVAALLIALMIYFASKTLPTVKEMKNDEKGEVSV